MESKPKKKQSESKPKEKVKKTKEKENPFKEKVNNELNPKQLFFCELYTTADKEFFGNGTLSYMEAYDQSNYKVAQACASRLLSNAIICEKINSLLEIGGFNDQNVEKQHLFLINQFSDLKTKKGALDSYYKLKGKFIEKIEHSGEIKTTMPYDRAKAIISGRNRSD